MMALRRLGLARRPAACGGLRGAVAARSLHTSATRWAKVHNNLAACETVAGNWSAVAAHARSAIAARR